MIAPTPPGYVMDGSHVSVMFVSGMQVSSEGYIDNDPIITPAVCSV